MDNGELNMELNGETTREEWDAHRREVFPDGTHNEYETCWFAPDCQSGSVVASWYCSTGQCRVWTREYAVDVACMMLRNRAANILVDDFGRDPIAAEVAYTGVLPG